MKARLRCGMSFEASAKIRRFHPRAVIQIPTIVTARPMNIVAVNGSEKSAQAHTMVIGGLR
ncbi:hypothetical protein Rleg10DRAFT_5482 [Rhizobium leguminosarum bv. trifolii WSM2012]|nr:hypothetical protein Rleg10DRAFT_5482 [Rhizobium leguminosarum bv. trifolii WSM2012]